MKKPSQVSKSVTKKVTDETAPQNSVTASALLFSGLFVTGGTLLLFGDFLTGASSFALAAVFSSISTPWEKIPAWARISITVSTLFGIGCLAFAIVTAG